MSDFFLWLIDPSGGPKRIRTDIADEKVKEGWVIVPQRDMNEKGLPKQTYFPRYDKQNPESLVEVDDEEVNKEILNVEVF